jgi:hypothetical protein
MKKLNFLLLALAMMINLASIGIGCKAKAPKKPLVKEKAKPAEPPAQEDDDD